MVHFVENPLWISAALQCIPNVELFSILIILCRHQRIFPVHQCPSHNTRLVVYRMVRRHGSVGIAPYVWACGIAYLDFDSLVWLAVDKQVQEENNTVGFFFVSEYTVCVINGI